MSANNVSTPGEMVWRYMFDIEADVLSQWVGEAPKGERVDIQYPAGKVVTSGAKFLTDWWRPLNQKQRDAMKSLWTRCEVQSDDEWKAAEAFRKMDEAAESDTRKQTLKSLREGQIAPLQWFGFEGEIISGSNWATFRRDVVAEFSGRMTFKSKDKDEALIDAVFSGVVDLCTDDADEELSDPRTKARQQWEGGSAASAQMLLAVTFDVGKAAQKWAPKRYLRQAKGYWKYQRLTQGQFVAVGNLEIGSKVEKRQMSRGVTASWPHTANVKLAVYEVRPTLKGASAGVGPKPIRASAPLAELQR